MNTSNRVAYSRPTINSRHQSNQRNDNINPQPRSFPGPISDASVPVVVFQPRELAPSQPNLGSANHTFRDHTFTEQDSMAVACLLFGLNSTVRTFNEAVKRLLQLAFVKVHPQVEKQLTDAWFAYYIQVGCNPTFENQVRALTKQTTEAEMILTFHHTFAWLGTIGILDEEPLICRPLELIDDRDYIDLT